jgi:hypothetical protein
LAISIPEPVAPEPIALINKRERPVLVPERAFSSAYR